MTSQSEIRPSLYWISGSPPSWRVMLGLLIKNVDYASIRLDHGAGENKRPEYLKINPRGQVPTLVDGPVTVRESIAILAYIDRAFDGAPLFGGSNEDAASIWQLVMEFENDLRPSVTQVAQILLRKQAVVKRTELDAAIETVLLWLNRLNERIDTNDWLASATPSAADCWLYPSLAWIERACEISDERYPKILDHLLKDAPNVQACKSRMEAQPKFETTEPPHWK